jgi:hypothetical protein
MKFAEIMEAIKKLNTEIREAEEKQKTETERYFATFEGLTIKERIAQKKENPEAEAEHLQRIAETQETITNGKLKLKLMQNNARISLFNEVMPIALEVLQKYNGKAHGEKTSQKIHTEIKEKTNCFVYVNGDSFRIVPCGTVGNAYNVECGTKYENGNKKKVLIDNKINLVSMEDLEVYYINRTYFEDLDATVKELKRIHAEAKQKQEELKALCEQFNKLSVKGIADLNHTEYSFNSII